MELKVVDIYANDRFLPTISITYMVNKEKEITMFRMWLRKDKAEDFETINTANTLLYKIIVFNSKPKEHDIMRAYQKLFARKLWNPPKFETTIVNAKGTLKVAPHRNMIEIDKNYFKEFVQNETNKHIRENQRKGKQRSAEIG